MYVQDFIRLITAAVRDDEKVELKNKVTQAQVKAVLKVMPDVIFGALRDDPNDVIPIMKGMKAKAVITPAYTVCNALTNNQPVEVPAKAHPKVKLGTYGKDIVGSARVTDDDQLFTAE